MKMESKKRDQRTHCVLHAQQWPTEWGRKICKRVSVQHVWAWWKPSLFKKRTSCEFVEKKVAQLVELFNVSEIVGLSGNENEAVYLYCEAIARLSTVQDQGAYEEGRGVVSNQGRGFQSCGEWDSRARSFWAYGAAFPCFLRLVGQGSSGGPTRLTAPKITANLQLRRTRPTFFGFATRTTTVCAYMFGDSFVNCVTRTAANFFPRSRLCSSQSQKSK